tara:strand:+ start:2433 stop:4808 length:2376 start_codon:yes stop_codon:yes gene_type:complete
MKNKYIYIIVLLFFLVIKNNLLFADPFNIKAEKIFFQNDKNLLLAQGGVEVISDNGIIINSDEITYDKKNQILKAFGNVILIDKQKNIRIFGEEILYEKKLERIFFNKKNKINFNDEYFLDSENINYFKNLEKISSTKPAFLKDNKNNFYTLGDFTYSTESSILTSKKISFTDNKQNELQLNTTYIDLLNNKLSGKDLEMKFDNKTFNKDNEPRLKANSVEYNNGTTNVSKGIFTTCKKNDNCPPWSLSAEKITHNKDKKRISYDNSWLKIYDQPVFYFPKFYHPDPTVKRQSGFLMTSLSDSTNFGASLTIPYYKVINDNSDLTFKPRIYNVNETIMQTEYRHNLKKSAHIFDFSYAELEDTKSHFFSKSNFDIDWFEESNLEVRIEKTSDTEYLKNYKIKSPIIKSETVLESFVKLSTFGNDTTFDLSMEVFENLDSTNDDKFEYVFPNFIFSKLLNPSENIPGQLTFSSSGYKKLYNTNTEDNILVNDFDYESDSLIYKSGILSSSKFQIKNFNSTSKNSSKYDNKLQNKFSSIFMYNVEYPLIKKSENWNSYLTPKIQARISPSNTSNLNYDDVRINYDSIFSLNRIGNSNTLEGGESLTFGAEYKSKDKDDNDIINLNLASIFRTNENEDLSRINQIGNKASDIIGNLTVNPNKYVKFGYDFSIDNSFSKSSYDSIKTDFTVNNFITSFEYLNEDNEINQFSNLYNKTTYNFDDTNYLSFSTRRNRKLNLTEFYNLIYEYRNDCLKAGLEYKKDYYTDSTLRPEEQLLFSITIMPFGKVSGPDLKR